MSTDTISASLVTGIKGAREVVLENSSHTPVLEETEKYLAAISEFMQAAEGSPHSRPR
jgi:pimeloyl-ACP methyl ester carboxylesterase